MVGALRTREAAFAMLADERRQHSDHDRATAASPLRSLGESRGWIIVQVRTGFCEVSRFCEVRSGFYKVRSGQAPSTRAILALAQGRQKITRRTRDRLASAAPSYPRALKTTISNRQSAIRIASRRETSRHVASSRRGNPPSTRAKTTRCGASPELRIDSGEPKPRIDSALAFRVVSVPVDPVSSPLPPPICSRRRWWLAMPPLRPASRASSLVHSCAVPFWCAAFPPLLAISRCLARSIDANPRSSLATFASSRPGVTLVHKLRGRVRARRQTASPASATEVPRGGLSSRGSD